MQYGEASFFFITPWDRQNRETYISRLCSICCFCCARMLEVILSCKYGDSQRSAAGGIERSSASTVSVLRLK